MTTVEVPRNGRGQPLIIPPGGGRPVPYNRSSSFAEVLDDNEGIVKWKIRLSCKGITQDMKLFLGVANTHITDKGEIDRLARAGFVLAGGNEAAELGTYLHSITEDYDRNGIPLAVPTPHLEDVVAYANATARYSMKHIEAFMVCDELKIAGTPDRLMYDRGQVVGPLLVGDLKTGSSDRYLAKHAAQLAVYAHSVLYDPATGERTKLNINQEVGVIFHMPAGQGFCNLYEVDLVKGWMDVQLAALVRANRKVKGSLRLINNEVKVAA